MIRNQMITIHDVVGADIQTHIEVVVVEVVVAEEVTTKISEDKIREEVKKVEGVMLMSQVAAEDTAAKMTVTITTRNEHVSNTEMRWNIGRSMTGSEEAITNVWKIKGEVAAIGAEAHPMSTTTIRMMTMAETMRTWTGVAVMTTIGTMMTMMIMTTITDVIMIDMMITGATQVQVLAVAGTVQTEDHILIIGTEINEMKEVIKDTTMTEMIQIAIAMTMKLTADQ